MNTASVRRPFYKWRAKFGGMDTLLMARLKELENENRWLKEKYAEERLKAESVREELAIGIDLSLPAERLVGALDQVIEWRGTPHAILRSQNGQVSSKLSIKMGFSMDSPEIVNSLIVLTTHWVHY